MLHRSASLLVVSIALLVTGAQAQELAVRMNAARTVHNACVREWFGRAHSMLGSVRWQSASSQRRGFRRSRELREVEQEFGFHERATYSYAKQLLQDWIGNHLTSQEVGQLSVDTFWRVKRALIKGEAVPLVGDDEPMPIRTRNNSAGIRWRAGKIHWKGLVLDPQLAPDDPALLRALDASVRYVEIAQEMRDDELIWTAQLHLKEQAE